MAVVARASPGCHARHLVGCRTTSCVLQDCLVCKIPLLARALGRQAKLARDDRVLVNKRLTRYINGPMPYAFILCIARYPSAARALD